MAILALKNRRETRRRRLEVIQNRPFGIKQPDDCIFYYNLEERLGVTYASAQKILRRLEKAGILSQIPGTRPQAWIARGILDLTRL